MKIPVDFLHPSTCFKHRDDIQNFKSKDNNHIFQNFSSFMISHFPPVLNGKLTKNMVYLYQLFT